MQSPRSLSGFRDFLPAQALQRRELIDKVIAVFERFGFATLDTPAMEGLATLTGKYGDEGEQLIFKVLKRGGDLQRALDAREDRLDPNKKADNLADMAMRYDLTVPLARIVAQYRSEIKLPFKRYQIAPVWRAESAKKGRFREFYQCDADIVGSSDMLADAEIVMIIYSLLSSLGFSRFSIRVNNRKILDGLLESYKIPQDQQAKALRVLDKLEKIGVDQAVSEMAEDGIDQALSETFIQQVMTTGKVRDPRKTLIDLSSSMTSQTGIDGITEISTIFNILFSTEARKSTNLDLSIARGLDYYTGTVFETTLLDAPDFGSVMSGGRFDKLIGMFMDHDVPAVGASLGLDRLFSAMEQLELLAGTKVKTKAEYFIAVMGTNNWAYALEIADKLRIAGKNVYLYPSDTKIGSQLALANDLGVSTTIIIGDSEREKRQVTIRDMTTRTQKAVPLDDLV